MIGVAVYRVFEALDELVVIVEESRGVPMTAGCVVPRGNVLDLLDDIKESLPPEMDDAQDVLDRRDALINEARASAESDLARANAQVDQASRAVADATLLASLDGHTRDDVDAYALRSQQRAAHARANGHFARSIVPVKDINGLTLLAEDELIRADSTAEKLGALKPSFQAMG